MMADRRRSCSGRALPVKSKARRSRFRNPLRANSPRLTACNRAPPCGGQGLSARKRQPRGGRGFANVLNPWEEGDFAGGAREGCKVALIGGMGHLGSTLEVDDASTQDTP